MKSKISVIIPAYNIEKYISICLNSIINQSLDAIEIIVVNDGSTDNTFNVTQEFSKKHNITVIDKENGGTIEARKDGLSVAKGEYVLFVDGDDWIEENCLKILYKNAKSNNSDIVLYNVFYAFDDSKISEDTYDLEKIELHYDYLRALFLGEVIPSVCCKFIRRKFLVENHVRFPSNCSYGEDLATVASMFINNPKVSYVNENLYNYYQRENSITKVLSEKILELNLALTFIKDELVRNDLYDKYEKGFERLVYKHLFLDRIYNLQKLNKFSRKAYKQYKTYKVNIKTNKYIYKDIEESLGARIRVNTYLINYDLGRVYDFCRKLLKR